MYCHDLVLTPCTSVDLFLSSRAFFDLQHLPKQSLRQAINKLYFLEYQIPNDQSINQIQILKLFMDSQSKAVESTKHLTTAASVAASAMLDCTVINDCIYNMSLRIVTNIDKLFSLFYAGVGDKKVQRRRWRFASCITIE